jgi:hypothetical protein
MFAGITRDSGHRAVRVVSDSQAHDVKQGFSEVLSEQIYSLTPSVAAPDASSLIAGDVEQARQMMSALLKNDKVDSGGRVRATDLQLQMCQYTCPIAATYHCPTVTIALHSVKLWCR